MNQASFPTYSQQRGIATLAISLLVLFLITMVTLYTASTSITEQRISANQYRADQALSAANAAMDYGVAYYDMGGVDHRNPQLHQPTEVEKGDRVVAVQMDEASAWAKCDSRLA